MTGVFVLGAHRSGTSAVTRVLNLMGLGLCRRDDLLPAEWSVGNPTGHWESLTVVVTDERLLGLLGGHWAHPPVPAPGWLDRPEVAGLVVSAAQRFRSVHPAEGWVCKDPRLCLTLPFWRLALGQHPVVVVVVRNPLDAARSLQARNRFSLAQGLALWERYTRAALLHSHGLAVQVVRYEELLGDPRRWWETARAFLGDHGVQEIGERWEEAALFLDKRLCHGTSSDAELGDHPAVSPEQRDLYRLGAGLTGIHHPLVVPGLGPETAALDSLLAPIGGDPSVRFSRLLDIEGVAAHLGLDPAALGPATIGGGGLAPPVLRTGTGEAVWSQADLDPQVATRG